MSELWRDVRSAMRSLFKSPGFAVVAVMTLALGVGATTAIYTVVQSVLLEPLPYPEPERMVLIQEKNPEAGFPRFSLSPLNYRDYHDMSTSFEAMAARNGTTLALAGEGSGMARRLSGRAVTAEFLRVYGVEPFLGRDFTEDDDRPGAARVILLGHGVWQDLGADPKLVGRDIRIDGEPTTVIGVLPPSFGTRTEALVPLAFDYESTGRGGHYLIGFGRLRDGVSVEMARQELETIAASLAETYPDSNTGWGAIVDPLHERVVERIRTALWVLMAAVVLVLLIACTNVANLTLARVASRQHELALRGALGAGRWRLLREQLTESAVLALVAGVAGVVLAKYATAWLVAMNADDIPRSESIVLDGGALAFALLMTLATVALFGLLPAWRAVRGDLAGSLKDGGRGPAGKRGSLRLRSALVLAEVALALVLLVASGLLIRSFARLLDVEPGFDPDPVWTAGLSLPDNAYDEEAERAVFYQRLLAEAAALPGVTAAASVMPMPLSGDDWINTTYLAGEPLPEPNQEHTVNVRFISPGYFGAVGIPFFAGRDFAATDNADAAPVLVVNRSAVDRFWPGEEALGQRISFGRPDQDEVRWYTVVGVVGDVHHASLEQEAQPAFYRAVFQDTPSYATIVLATVGDPGSLAGPLRELVHRLDANLPLVGEQRASDLVAGSLAEPRFNATLLTIFAGLALVLAAIGVFGVVAYLVTLRQREFGVRVALGARASQILSLVLTQGMRPVLAGVVLGLGGAFAASRLLASLVYGVGVSDPVTYGIVALLLAGIASLACLVPAWRAVRVDPMEVLRDE